MFEKVKGLLGPKLGDINWGKLVFLVFLATVALGMVSLGACAPEKAFIWDLALVLVGALFAAGMGIINSLANQTESYKLGSFTERAQNIQGLFSLAGEVRIKCLDFCIKQHLEVETDHKDYQEAAKKRLEEIIIQSHVFRIWVGKSSVERFRKFVKQSESYAFAFPKRNEPECTYLLSN